MEQDDEKVKEAADVATKAFEGGTVPNGVAAPREAPPPPAKKPSETDGHLTEKETRSTGAARAQLPGLLENHATAAMVICKFWRT